MIAYLALEKIYQLIYQSIYFHQATCDVAEGEPCETLKNWTAGVCKSGLCEPDYEPCQEEEPQCDEGFVCVEKDDEEEGMCMPRKSCRGGRVSRSFYIEKMTLCPRYNYLNQKQHLKSIFSNQWTRGLVIVLTQEK